MSRGRPIILIDDDPDDVQLFRMAMDVLNVDAPLHCFLSAPEALDFLNNTTEPPGLILCDNHLAAISGMDLRQQLAENKNLHHKDIPFVLLSTAISEAEIIKAYELPVQGIFLKASTFDKYLDQLDRILKYWSISVTPNAARPSQGWR